MNRFAKLWKNERGLTLVELIATLSIIIIVSGLAFTLLQFGLNSYEKIKIEQQLRDEADYVMSSIMMELYTKAPETLKEEVNGFVMSGGVLLEDDDTAIYIDNGEISVGDRVLDITATLIESSSLKVSCSTSANASTCSSGIINISLLLEKQYGGKSFQVELASKFGF